MDSRRRKNTTPLNKCLQNMAIYHSILKYMKEAMVKFGGTAIPAEIKVELVEPINDEAISNRTIPPIVVHYPWYGEFTIPTEEGFEPMRKMRNINQIVFEGI